MLILPLLLLLLLPLLRAQRRAADPSAALQAYRRTAWVLGGIVLSSMAAQELILLFAGQLTWATGLPLHLCSLMGVLLLPALLTRWEPLMHALLFGGAPGALLALLFPAVADTPWPLWTGFFFRLMHAGLLCGPLPALLLGWRPRPEGALQAWLTLLFCGIVAMAANALTGGNYLFLSGPVAGTPLMLLAQWGRTVYRLLLAIAAGLLIAAGGFAVHLLRRALRR